MRLIQDLRKHEFCPKLYSAALLIPPLHSYLITSDENQHLFFWQFKADNFFIIFTLTTKTWMCPFFISNPKFLLLNISSSVCMSSIGQTHVFYVMIDLF